MTEIEKKIFEGSFLTERQKTILQLRISYHTLADVGHEIGVTRERIRQIGETIKRKLRDNLTEEELKEYSEWYLASRKRARGTGKENKTGF